MRKFGAVLVVIFLLPCVIAVFIKGADVLKLHPDLSEYIETEDGVTLRWEAYFLGSLAASISEGCEPEMIKAQAVVLRTQAAAKLQAGEKLKSHYLTMEELTREWSGEEYQRKLKQYQKAMRETKREVLCYEEQLALAPFHALSSGMTRNATEVFGGEKAAACPYLVSVDCSVDKEAEGAMQVQTYSYREVQKRCQPFLVALDGARGTDPAEENVARGTVPAEENVARGTDPVEENVVLKFEDFEVVTKDSAGYVTEIQILGNVYSGEQFRQALELPSSAFTLQDYQGQLRITTMGLGHGLGMSQHTANEMAKGGATYQKILEYFFVGTHLQKNEEIFLNLE